MSLKRYNLKFECILFLFFLLIIECTLYLCAFIFVQDIVKSLVSFSVLLSTFPNMDKPSTSSSRKRTKCRWIYLLKFNL